MKTIYRYFLLLALPLCLTVACEEEYEDKLTGTNPQSDVVDVSERITGFETEMTGGGATLEALGNNLENVKRVMIAGNLATEVESSENSVTFIVPVGTPLGEQTVYFIFSGNERATATIEVAPLPSVSFVDPIVGNPGDLVIIHGVNMNYVNSITIGEVEANILDQSGEDLSFIVPEGVTTAPIVLAGNTGTLELDQFIVCSENPGELRCKDPVNPNGSFEEGEYGAVGEIAVPGWGLNEGGVANMEIVPEPTRGGRKALKVEILDLGANPWNIEATNGIFAVEPNTTYHYSVKVNGPSGARANFTVGRPNYSEISRTEATLAGGWEEITQEFTTGPEDTEIRLPIHFSITGNVGATIYIDDMRVVNLGE